MTTTDALTRDAADLDDRLQAAIALQEAATPEPDSCEDRDDAPINYAYICECHRTRFDEKETDEIRASITDLPYYIRELGAYKVEVDRKMTTILEMIRDDGNGANDHGVNNSMLSTEKLRDMIGVYQQLLVSLGYTPQDAKELRYTISDPNYWRPESIALSKKAALRENELIEEHHNAKTGRAGPSRTASTGEAPQPTRKRPARREVKHKPQSGVQKRQANGKTGSENFARPRRPQVGCNQRRTKTIRTHRDLSKLLQ